MSEEIAKKMGLKIGQHVLYPSYTPYVVTLRVVTIKDVRILPHNNEVVVDVEELQGYLKYEDVYTQTQINSMFDFYNSIEEQKV